MSTTSELERDKIKQKEEEAKKKAELEDKERKSKTGREVLKTVGGLASSVVKAMNDLDWYTRLYGDPAVNMNVSDFQQGEEENPGYNLAFGVTDTVLHSDVQTNPGVYCVNWIPTIGDQKIEAVTGSEGLTLRVSSALNNVISRLKSQLEKSNSRITPYSNDTVGRYLVGTIDGPVAVLKLIGIAINAFDYADAIYPKVAAKLITALGFNYNDFALNISRYKTLYVKWASQFNENLVIIDDLNFRKRRDFCVGKIMRDANSKRAQYIVWTPTHIAKVNSSDIVEYVPFRDVYYTVINDYLEEQNEFWTKGNTWKPFVRDLRGGITSDHFYQMPSTYEDVNTTIDVVDEVMAQFHNMRMYPAFFGSLVDYSFDSSSLALRGDAAENLIQGPVLTTPIEYYHVAKLSISDIPDFAASVDEAAKRTSALNDVLGMTAEAYAGAGGVLINQYKPFAEGDIMVDTRLTSCFKIITAQGSSASKWDATIYPTHYGTEVVLSISVVGAGNLSDHSATTWMANDTFGKYYAPKWGNNAAIGTGSNGKTVRALSNVYLLNFTYANHTPVERMDLYQHLSLATMLDWYPAISILDIFPSQLGTKYYFRRATVCELREYLFIGVGILERLHEQAITSEFSIPSDVIRKQGPVSNQ